jgi:hypothetical protein
MTVGFLSHIERAPSGLPIVQYHARKLAIRTSRKTGKERVDVWTDFDTDFVVDMPALQSGWVSYREGTGRVLSVEPVTPDTTEITVPKPADEKVSAVAIVPVMGGEAGMAEMEIADTALSAAFSDLYNAYLEATERRKGLIPEVHFHTGAKPRFDIEGWHKRDNQLWGEI